MEDSDRLDSWKEIAAYLGREVRTVQSWEKGEGLPIHRHQHAKQGSVFAFKSELDAWREARRTVTEFPLALVAEKKGPTPRMSRRGILLIAIGVTILLAASLITIRWLSRPRLEPLKGVPLTSAVGQELEPSLSPDSNQVVYSWNGANQDNFDIYVKLIGAGTPLRLTTDPAADSSPAWSRDGRYIAFLRQLPAGKAQVVVIPSLGGPERVVAEVFSWPPPWRLYPGPHVTWSPDGKGLIVSHRPAVSQPFALYYLTIDSGELRRITNPPPYTTGDTAPALSPNGRTLAFRRSLGVGAGQLYLAKTNDHLEIQGDPNLLDGISPTSPAWMSDSEVVYSDGYYFDPVLKRLTLPWLGAGAGKIELLGLSGAFVSSSRQKIIYAASTFDTNTWEIQLPGTGANLQARNLIDSTRMDTGAQYSPDGKRIAFLSARSGSGEIWVCDRDGGKAIQLTSFGDAAAPRWSPDGTQIVFLARYKGLEKIYVIRSSGGEPRQLTTGPGRDHIPSWSLDGRFIYFRSSRGGDNQVWKVPAGGGPEARVTKAGGDLALESHDGNLYFSKRSGDGWSLWKLAPSGEESQLLPSVYPMTNFYVSRNGVYFTPHPRPDGSTTIELYRFATGKVETVATISKPIWFGLSVTADDSAILYTQIDHEESNLMLAEPR